MYDGPAAVGAEALYGSRGLEKDGLKVGIVALTLLAPIVARLTGLPVHMALPCVDTPADSDACVYAAETGGGIYSEIGSDRCTCG